MGIQAQSAKVTINWPSEVTIGPDGYFLVFGNDGAGGPVDYNTALTNRKTPAWPSGQYPGGFGTGPFGRGGFGYGYKGFGFGNGPFGRGPFGRGAAMLTASLSGVADGEGEAGAGWILAVVGYDAAGNADPQGDRTSVALDVAGEPEPPGTVTPSYTAGDVTFGFVLSPDDEGS